MTDRVTVVVPCAGAGSRLGTSVPKELLPVGVGSAVVDYSFEIIRRARIDVRVLVVLASHKGAVVTHLERYADELAIAFVYQRSEHRDIAGAVRATLPWCDERVVLLLPDQWMQVAASRSPLDELVELLDDHAVAVLACRADDAAALADDGALEIGPRGSSTPVVLAHHEKPGALADRYNAAWVALACRREALEPLLDVISEKVPSVERARSEPSPLLHAPVVEVDGYSDLGVWCRYVGHLRRIAGAQVR